jgi:ornithine cyclodeaminase
MAFGALADVATGMPRFVSELTLTTALRTAATSVMVARRWRGLAAAAWR